MGDRGRGLSRQALLIILMLLGSEMFHGAAAAAASAPERMLTIGRATRDVALEEKRWFELLKRLNRPTDGTDLPKVALRMTSSTAGLLWEFWDDRIQVFVGEPFVAASLIRQIDAVPLFVIEDEEPSSQRAVIIVKDEREDAAPVELLGRRLAFSRHGSGLAHLLPLSTLLRRGLKANEVIGNVPIAPDRIGTFHLRDDRSPLMWLYRAEPGPYAAAVSLGDFRRVARSRPGLFRPVLMSPRIPIAVAIASNAVDPATRRSLAERLGEARSELFEALGVAKTARATFRPVTMGDPVITDLLERMTIVETAAEVMR